MLGCLAEEKWCVVLGEAVMQLSRVGPVAEAGVGAFERRRV
jgi:hypothetical protein